MCWRGGGGGGGRDGGMEGIEGRRWDGGRGNGGGGVPCGAFTIHENTR